MHGYTMVHLTDGCYASNIKYNTRQMTVAECMEECDSYPECDSFSYDVSNGYYTGTCDLWQGPCDKGLYSDSHRYQRRGRLISEAIYVIMGFATDCALEPQI